MNLTTNEAAIEFKPERIGRSADFIVHGKVTDVFPLFGPIREKEWAAGWEPEILYPIGDEFVEEHMIFQTNGHAGEEKYRWVITQYNPEKYTIEYTVSTSQRIWFIRVVCKEDGENTKTTVSYSYTGLSEEGNRKNKQALSKMFIRDMKDWEEALNYYLKTGKQLSN
jgi:hypothetical protein